MTNQLTRRIPVAALGSLMLVLTGLAAPADEPKPPGGAGPDPNGAPDEDEVLAKGPVHEAYATTAEPAGPPPVVARQPPEPRDEVVPDHKPEDPRAQWIPGYWDWDDDEDRFRWVSGCWRVPPPGHAWTAGSWRPAPGGWQWAPGFWQPLGDDERPELTYLSKPEDVDPADAEPSVPPPTPTSICLPGCHVWCDGKYKWRPGVWVEHRPDCVLVPARYCWTPLGYVFVESYWDHPLAARGVLFAPVAFARARGPLVYAPVYVVSEPCLVGALFVRRGRPHYYFGDYFAEKYAKGGYRPWAGRVVGTKFALGAVRAHTWGHDPLWTHYTQTRRGDRDWHARVAGLYAGRYSGTVERPPATLAQQNAALKKVAGAGAANPTGAMTIDNRAVLVNKRNVTDVAMLAPLAVAKHLQPDARIKPIAPEARKVEGQAARDVQQAGVQRAKLEAAALVKLPAPNPGAQQVFQPRTLKLEVPKTVVERARVSDDKRFPPPVYKPEPRPAPPKDPTDGRRPGGSNNNPPGKPLPGPNPAGKGPPGTNTTGKDPPTQNPPAGKNPPGNGPPAKPLPGTNPAGKTPAGTTPSGNNPPAPNPSGNSSGKNPQAPRPTVPKPPPKPTGKNPALSAAPAARARK